MTDGIVRRSKNDPRIRPDGVTKRESSGTVRPVVEFPLSANALAVKGGYTPTSTRSTTAAFTDYEGVVRMASVNELRFEGGRRVENLCPNSEPTTGWSVLGTTPPMISYEEHLGFNAVKILFQAGSDVGYAGCTAKSSSAPIAIGNTYVSQAKVHFSRALTASEEMTIYVTGANSFSLVTISAGNSTYSGSTYATLTVSKLTPCTVNGTVYFAAYVKNVLTAPLTVWITQTQIERITGSGYTLPSEYVPTAGAAASKWFATKPNGSPIYPAPKLIMEGQSQNKIPHKTANPVDTTGTVMTGDAAAVLSVVDDVSALAAAGLSAICSSGKVYKLDNSAGTTYAYCKLLPAVGNTNIHSASVYIG